MNWVILDTETTGVSSIDQVIELAKLYMMPTIKDNCIQVENLLEATSCERFRPTVPINERAYEVHGIRMKDLLSCPSSLRLEAPKAVGYIGHNVSFDHRMLKKPNVKLICTLGLARSLDKQLKLGFENHKLDTLSEHYYPDLVEVLNPKLHSAKLDVIKCFLVLIKLVEHLPNIKTFDELYSFQQTLKTKQ